MKKILFLLIAAGALLAFHGCEKDSWDRMSADLKPLSDGLWVSDDNSVRLCFLSPTKKDDTGMLHGFGLYNRSTEKYSHDFEWFVEEFPGKPYMLKMYFPRRENKKTESSYNLSLLGAENETLNLDGSAASLSFNKKERTDIYASLMLLPAVWDWDGYTAITQFEIFGADEGEVAYMPKKVMPVSVGIGSEKPKLSKNPGIMFHHDPASGKFSADIIEYDSAHDGGTLLKTLKVNVRNENDLDKIQVTIPGLEQYCEDYSNKYKMARPVYGSPAYEY